MQRPALFLHHIQKRLGQHTVLQDACLQVMEGECTLLQGENGAGKTTLLRIASGLMTPDAGDMHWFGHDAIPPNTRMRALLGVIGHQKGFYTELSGYENLQLTATLYQAPMCRIEEALTTINLSAWAFKPVRTYSAGMLQRLALARCLVQKPRLLLLDEPYAGLDRPTTDLVAHILHGFIQAGAAILMTTHHIPTSLAQLGVHSVWLHRGKIGQGPP